MHGRPEGATSAACGTTTDIAPSHNGNLPSDTALPYSVDLNDFTDGQYIPGNNYTSKRQCSYITICIHVQYLRIYICLMHVYIVIHVINYNHLLLLCSPSNTLGRHR